MEPKPNHGGTRNRTITHRQPSSIQSLSLDVTDKLKQSETEIRVVWQLLWIIPFENKQVTVQNSTHNIQKVEKVPGPSLIPLLNRHK
jgi:hypothetical protein